MSQLVEFTERDVLAYVNGEPLRRELAEVAARLLGVPPWILTAPSGLPTRHIFLILTASTEEWQLDLREHLFRHLDEARISYTVFSTRENYSWSEQQALRAQVLACKEEFDAGMVVISTWGPERAEALRTFATSFAKPLIYIDKNPCEGEAMPENVAYVSVSDKKCAELAGHSLVNLLGKQLRRVLVVSGDAKQDRVGCFAETIRSRVANCDVEITLDGEFNREKGGAVAFDLIADAISCRRPFQAVYGTADSLAFGVVDANAQIAERFGCDTPAVFSYDGLPEMRAMVPTGQIVGTVIQDACAVAQACVHELVVRLFEFGRSNRVVWVPPKLFGGSDRFRSSAPSGSASERAEEFDAELMNFALLRSRTITARRLRREVLGRINELVRRAQTCR